ncbi:MAG: glutaredoxin 2, partial [Burkholderia sp.]|nr:glutaredoxin 2 [Burkholderia sp.]
MLHALQAMPQAAGLPVDVVDVDADEVLLRAYDERVPVLIGVGSDGIGRELCHYF